MLSTTRPQPKRSSNTSKTDNMQPALTKIRFYKKGYVHAGESYEGYIVNTKPSLVTAFRNYIGLAMAGGFSDLDTTPHPESVIPLLFTGMHDRNGAEIWEGDRVMFDIERYSEGQYYGECECEIVYCPKMACFGVKPLDMEDPDGIYPMFGISEYVRVLCNKYEMNEK